MIDGIRIWLTRALAPLAFLAAATVLVVAVQRALDEENSAATIAVSEPTESVPVTTETGADEVPEEEREFYRIKAGDTLESIASRFETSVERLRELNPGLDPLALNPGKRIRVA